MKTIPNAVETRNGCDGAGVHYIVATDNGKFAEFDRGTKTSTSHYTSLYEPQPSVIPASDAANQYHIDFWQDALSMLEGPLSPQKSSICGHRCILQNSINQ